MSKEFIARAEKEWLGLIIKYSEELFTGHWMPSHDLEHHRRVWKYACDISLQAKKGNKSFYKELILACFFHDLGLVLDKSDKHGKKSKGLCSDFLAKHSEKVDFDPKWLLEAIELHDDKEYKVKLDNNPIYRYLTISDDMDAFGALGVYRYVEIYILRGLKLQEIPNLILKNAESRFNKIISQINSLSINPKPFKERYLILQKYLENDAFQESPHTLVQWLNMEVITKRTDPFAIFSKYRYTIDNERIENFISQIFEELESS